MCYIFLFRPFKGTNKIKEACVEFMCIYNVMNRFKSKE
jgi:hypothetical protein